jgi:hypothetical protein
MEWWATVGRMGVSSIVEYRAEEKLVGLVTTQRC